MILTELPIEIQEKILVNVIDNTKLNLVCSLWNELCKRDIIKDKRFPCICNLSVFHAIKCKSRKHVCICLNDIDSIHYALRCRATEHPCICSNGTPNHSTTCRSKIHNCICNIDEYHRMRCKSTFHLTN